MNTIFEREADHYVLAPVESPEFSEEVKGIEARSRGMIAKGAGQLYRKWSTGCVWTRTRSSWRRSLA